MTHVKKRVSAVLMNPVVTGIPAARTRCHQLLPRSRACLPGSSR